MKRIPNVFHRIVAKGIVAAVAATILMSAALAQSGTLPPTLTPKPPPTPRINGARVFGVRPGNPFLFTVAATGERPMKFSAANLPDGLSIDSSNGRITGVLTKAGETTVTLRAENALGKAERKFRIVCGDTIALTPPMGWNPWNCFAKRVKESNIRDAADAMVSSRLINHGWTYINLDDCWSGKRDAAGFIRGNENFPDMKALADYVHSKGLKFGVYSSPGPQTCAKFTASFQHEDQDAQRFAEWGVDYVKYDWCSYYWNAQERTIERYTALSPEHGPRVASLMREQENLKKKLTNQKTEDKSLSDRKAAVTKELEDLLQKLPQQEKNRIDREILQEPYRVFRASLDKVKRDIVYSVCQYGMGNVWEWAHQVGANCWRTTYDIADTWNCVSKFAQKQSGLEIFAGPGHWNDPDMLVVGKVGMYELRPTRLTPDEQYSHISWWCLLAAPLLIGCDLTEMDDFTLGLLTNDEVLEVNQDPLGKQATRVSKGEGGAEVWAKNMEDGSRAVGMFNLGTKEIKVTARWSDLGVTGKQTVRDLWRQKNLGDFDGLFEAAVPPHGVVLVKVAANKQKEIP